MRTTLQYLSIVIISFAFIGLQSCQKGDGYSEYEGNWTGIYDGDETGTWEVSIDGNGRISGAAYPDSIQGLSYTLTGFVEEDGAFNAQSEILDQLIEFDGKLDGTNGSGTWRNVKAMLFGDWSGSKK